MCVCVSDGAENKTCGREGEKEGKMKMEAG